jgi:hypothetical protein
METLEIVKQIHNRFDEATDELKQIAHETKSKAESFKPVSNNNSKGATLVELGFTEAKEAKEYVSFKREEKKLLDQKTHLLNFSERIREGVDYWSGMFPFHKFILYSQVISILEDYNLFIAPSNLYKGDIPDKNMREIVSFEKEYLNTYGRTQHVIRAEPDKPLCAQSNTPDWGKIKYYICAPRHEIKSGKHTTRIGREVFENTSKSLSVRIKEEIGRINSIKIPDPIVLLPILTDRTKIGFIVVSKWGDEAEIQELNNGIVN